MCIAHLTEQLDRSRSDAFAQKLLEHCNSAAIGLMISIGHRTGLFDTLGDGQWITTRDLAEKAELSERYVREWAGAMVTGGILEYREVDNAYRMPAEHAACLTRAATPNNLASVFQWIAVLGSVEDQVVEAFRHGRGVPYSAYRRFNEVMAEESGQTVVAALEEHILPLAPGLRQKLEEGVDVVDVGCGRGRAIMHLAELFPNSRFTGLDLLEDAINDAILEAQDRGLTNVTFRQQDAATWNETARYDVIFTFDSVHDQARPDLMLANIRRALKPGGTYLMQDILGSSYVQKNMEHPLAPFIYTISCMHCMSVSLANNGMGLGAMWGKETALRMLAEAGFHDVTVKTLPHDVLNYYYVING